MHPSVRRSIWAKMTALGFIYLIILGNFWFSYRLFGHHSPEWLLEAFVIGLPFVFIGGMGVIFLAVKQLIHDLKNPQVGQDETEQD